MKLLKWLIKMAKKILNLDTENGEQSWEDGESLPSGTVNQTLRHNGTEWVANSKVIADITPNSANIKVFRPNTIPSQQYPMAYLQSVYTGSVYGMVMVACNNSSLANMVSTLNYNTNKTESTVNLVSAQSSIEIKSTAPADNTSAIRVSNSGGAITYFSVLQNGKIVSNYLSGTGSALLEATSDGTIQRSATALPTRTEYLSGLLSGTEHTFTGATLGITGDLRSRIKNIKCFAVDSNGDFNGALIANEFIYETELVVNSATNLSGSFSIKLFIEYV